MNPSHEITQGSRSLWVLIALLVTACIAFPLLSVWKGYSPYRDIHLGTALEYARHGFQMENTRIVGFNASGTPTIQELPLWQMLVGVAFKLFGEWRGWANIVSCILFATALVPLYRIAKDLIGPEGGQWTLVFFLSQPLVFLNFGMAGTDGTSLSAAIWFWYLASRVLKSTSFSPWLWIAACVAGTLSALLKLPFFMATGVGLGCFLLWSDFRSIRNWISLSSIGLVAFIVFLVWTRYTDHLQAGAEFPFVDLRLSNPEMVFWFFGDWSYRLDPANWIKGGWRFLNTLFGSFVLIGLSLLGGWKSKPLWLPLCHLAGCAATTIIFSHIVLHHSHYYLMFAAAVALLSANACIWLRNSLPQSRRLEPGFTGIVGVLLSLAIIQGLIGMKVASNFDPSARRIAQIVETNTQAGDKLLIQGGGWGGDILIRTGRDGLSIWGTRFLENETDFRRLKELGYNKLVMISESPLLHSLQVTNPGSADRVRQSYSIKRTPFVEEWPVIHRDEDIIIQEIPN